MWKEILQYYSIHSLKTADSVCLNLFMTDNGRCDIPHASSSELEQNINKFIINKFQIKVLNSTVQKDLKMKRIQLYIDVRGDFLGPPYGTTTVVISKQSRKRSFGNTES